jgi:arabinogalactan endo-1,4-beta-galactosidase
MPSHRLTIRLAGLSAAGMMLVMLTSAAGPRADPAGLPGDTTPSFYLGADISALDAPSRFGRPHAVYQEHGKTSDELTILERHGWNAFRLRVFVSPVREAPDNSLEHTVPLAKRIKASGALFLLDIHYSDTWADPGHQETPVAWRGLSFDSLERQVETYSYNTIKALKDAGAMPDWVQVGNEVTRGMLWPLGEVRIPGPGHTPPPQSYDSVIQWYHLTGLLQAGIRGVRAAAGDTPPRIAIHIDRGGDWATTEWFFDHLDGAHVAYDIIAQSFYPPWRHGTLENLWRNMQECARRYDKPFLVVETGYQQSHMPDNPDMLWPVTPQGRLQFIVDLVNTVRAAPNGLGVMYWAPEWDLWRADGNPGPAVFTLDHLEDMARVTTRRSSPPRRSSTRRSSPRHASSPTRSPVRRSKPQRRSILRPLKDEKLRRSLVRRSGATDDSLIAIKLPGGARSAEYSVSARLP